MIDIFGWVMAVANVILICLIYAQYREQKKPIITTKIVPDEKRIKNGAKAIPRTLEKGDIALYLIVSNISNNLASNVKINYEFLLNGEKLAEVSKELDYLNPCEATDMIIMLGDIIDKRPDLFERIEHPNIKTLITHTIPKETMTLLLNIHISCNPFLGKFLLYEIKDSYYIVWSSRCV